MLEPNELLLYLEEANQQELQATYEMPEWLKNFLASDDEYDTFSKQSGYGDVYHRHILGYIYYTTNTPQSSQVEYHMCCIFI